MKKQDVVDKCINTIKKIKIKIPEIVFLYDLDNMIPDFTSAEFYLNNEKCILNKITSIQEITPESIVIFFDENMVFAVLKENMIIVDEDTRQHKDIHKINQEFLDEMIKTIEKNSLTDSFEYAPDRKSWESSYGPPKRTRKIF